MRVVKFHHRFAGVNFTPAKVVEYARPDRGDLTALGFIGESGVAHLRATHSNKVAKALGNHMFGEFKSTNPTECHHRYSARRGPHLSV